MTPTISVVLPFRNGRRHLGQALQSVQQQDYDDFELLAVDDGSTDGAAGLVRTFAAADPRIRVLKADGRGLPAALNTGIAAAAGRYIARMDGDDIALPTRFGAQVAALQGDPDLLVIGGAVDLMDARGHILETAWYPSTAEIVAETLAAGRQCLCHPATMIRRDALIQVGGYRTSVPLTEDFDLWLRLSRLGRLRNLDVRVLRYRLHGGSVAFHRTREQLTSLLRSALLFRLSQPAERASVERTTDVCELVRRLMPDEDPAEVLFDMTAWYVENASLAGEDRFARRMCADLASLVPTGRRPWFRTALSQTAALVASSRGRKLAALGYVLSNPGTRRDFAGAWRRVLRPPVVTARTDVSSTGAPAGYLDRVVVRDGGRTLSLSGHLPVREGRLPVEIAVGVPTTGTRLALRLVPRMDAARVFGEAHLHAGFRIEAALAQPVRSGDRVALWLRMPGEAWSPMEDVVRHVDAMAYAGSATP